MNAKAIAAVGARRIERRRAENAARREEIAEKLARFDEIERDNLSLRLEVSILRGAIAKFNQTVDCLLTEKQRKA